jgi:hypothetical protein
MFGLPGLRFPQHQEFRRGEPPAHREQRVHTFRIGVEQVAGFGREVFQIVPRPLRDAEGARHPIEAQDIAPRDLRQPPFGAAPHHLHLEHAVARMQPAERDGGVAVRLRRDARDAILVECDGDRRREARDRQLLPRFGEGGVDQRHREERAEHRHDGDQSEQTGEEAEDCAHAPMRWRFRAHLGRRHRLSRKLHAAAEPFSSACGL